MDDGSRIDAVQYLDRFFDAVREEARTNPTFSARLVEALGGEVVFSGDDKLALLNPLKLAAKGQTELLTAISGLSAGELKAVLKANNLASPVDVRGKDQSALETMLIERSMARLSERTQRDI
ncbi:MAG: hypothetical protein AAF638_09405 [Pseudomonadota bacterium]